MRLTGECNVCCLLFVMKCTAFIYDTLSRFVLTDVVSDDSLTMCSGYKKSGSDSVSGSIGGGGIGVHN